MVSWSLRPHLVPLGIKEKLPGLDKDVSAVRVAGHDGLLHHPPPRPPGLPHQDGHTWGEEHALPVPQVCAAVNKRPEDYTKVIWFPLLPNTSKIVLP